MSRILRRGKKRNIFFTELFPMADSLISIYFLLQLKKDMRLKKTMKFHKETSKTNSNNTVQNQEQVAVSSIASVVKTCTSSCSSGNS